MTVPTPSSALQNTDKQLWEDPTQDVGYRDYVSVTEDRKIVMCSGGCCMGKSVKEWVDLGFPKSERGMKEPPTPSTSAATCQCETICTQEIREFREVTYHNFVVTFIALAGFIVISSIISRKF